jgi:hypothetical protein
MVQCGILHCAYPSRLALLLQRDGLILGAIATELNAHGYRTRWGGSFHKATVLRLLRPLPRTQETGSRELPSMEVKGQAGKRANY